MFLNIKDTFDKVNYTSNIESFQSFEESLTITKWFAKVKQK